MKSFKGITKLIHHKCDLKSIWKDWQKNTTWIIFQTTVKKLCLKLYCQKLKTKMNFWDIEIHDSASQLKNWKKFDTEKAWANISSKINNKSQINWYKYVAVAVVLVFSVFAIRFFTDSSTKYKANGATDHLVLVDGSDIILDNGSELQLSSEFNSGNREVTLHGNAFLTWRKVHHHLELK